MAILFILLLIFFSQKLVRVLGAAVDGDIPTNLVFSLLGLGVPDMVQLILPLSLFLGLLMTFSRLYTESEITVMHACGMGEAGLLKAAMILAVVTALLAAANVLWASPWSARHQAEILAEARANPSLAAMVEGQFQSSRDGNSVLFVGNVKGAEFRQVFLAQLRPSENQRPSVVVADRGKIMQRADGSQVVTLNEGTRYEGTAMLRDFRVTHFTDYQAVIGHQAANVNDKVVEQMDMRTLWRSDAADARAELHWRLTLVVSVLIMALMAVPLSVVNPRQGRVMSLLPAMLLYLIYFLLQSSLRSNGGKEKLDPMLWMWLVNLAYFALALLLNGWDSLPARRLRARLWRTA